MHKRRNFAWLALMIIIPLFTVIVWSVYGSEKIKAAAGIQPTETAAEIIDQSDPYNEYVVAEDLSLSKRKRESYTFRKGISADFRGEPLSIRKEQNEKQTIIERRWDIPFVSLDLMSHLLDYDLSSTGQGDEITIIKDTEEGMITAVIRTSEREILVEFQDEKTYQKEVLLTALPYLNTENLMMIPLKDLLYITGHDIAFTGGDIIEIGNPRDESVKLHLLNYIVDNSEKEKDGYFERLSESQSDKEISFILLGDMGLGTSFGRKNPFDAKWQEHGGEHFLSHLKKDFDQADMVITNLENVFTDRSAYQLGKIFTFKAPRIEYLDVLSKGGITHVSVVNNHMVDYLQEGFDDTLLHLDEYGIEYFGTNLSKTDNIELGNIEVESYSVFEKDGFKIGMLGYLGFNTSHVSDEKILEDVEMLKEIEKVDYIIAAMHWGGQNTHEITWGQRTLGHKLIDYGVDLVYGNHPHVLQEVEVYKGKPIYYSLGNFLFINYSGVKDPDGMMVTVDLVKESSGNITGSFTHTPILWSGDKTANNYMPRYMDDEFMKMRALGKLKIETSLPIQFNENQ